MSKLLIIQNEEKVIKEELLGCYTEPSINNEEYKQSSQVLMKVLKRTYPNPNAPEYNTIEIIEIEKVIKLTEEQKELVILLNNIQKLLIRSINKGNQYEKNNECKRL